MAAQLTIDRDGFAALSREAAARADLGRLTATPRSGACPAPSPPGLGAARAPAAEGVRVRPAPALPPSGGMRSRALLLASRLCAAVRAEDDRMLVDLLQEGANPNLVLPEGVAAIHLAAGVEQGSGIWRLGLLLQHGGDPNARSGDDLTPVHVAASWGCASCLMLLLMEGGDPRLEDQDGNTALGLALEQGNKTCASILQGEQSSWFSQRRAESFLSTLDEDAGETGGAVPRLPESPPCPSAFSPKEALPGACSRHPGAVPSCAPGSSQARSTSSFLSEGSWQGSPCSDPAASCAPSAAAFFPSDKDARKPLLSRAEGPVCPAGGVTGSALETEPGVHRPCDPPGFPEGGSHLPLCLESVRLCDTSTDSPPPLPKLPSAPEAPEKPPASPGLPTVSELKADAPLGLQDGSRGHSLSWYCSFRDPLLVSLASQEGQDITLPGHVSQADPTGPLKARRALSGCSVRGRSSNGSSANSIDQFVSCLSECSVGSSKGPACTEAQRQGDRKATFGWSPGSSDGNSGLSHPGRGQCSGPVSCAGFSLETGAAGKASTPTRLEDLQLPQEGAPRREMWGVRQDPVFHSSRKSESVWDELLVVGAMQKEGCAVEPVAPGPEGKRHLEGSAFVAGEQTSLWGLQGKVHARAELPRGAKRGQLQRLGCPQGAEQKPSSPHSQDTSPAQGAPEEGSRSTNELGMSSSASDAEAALRPSASDGEEVSSDPDGRLQCVRLATEAFRLPLLQASRQLCHVTLWPQSPRAAPLLEESGSPSPLFDVALEMPQRPRRKRLPGDPSGKGVVAPSARNPPPTAGSIPAGPTDCQAVLGTSGGPVAGPAGPRNPGGDAAVGDAKGSSGATSCAADSVGCSAPERPPGKPGGECSRGLGTPSRVSFSRLSAWEPSGICPPARSSPISQDVPLSPGGRPVNLSATEAAEYLYVDVDKGHTLVERHVPPTEDSLAGGSSSSEDTVLYNWRAYASQGCATREEAPSKPCCLSYEALAQRLRGLAVCPGLSRTVDGPVLARLRRDPTAVAQKGSAAYSPELASALEMLQIPESREDEAALARQFDQPDKSRKWREGLLKSSFNYLLLDPRVTQNLPLRSRQLSQAECFRTFVDAVFYVGKGRRSRPYCHLYEALAHRQEGQRKQVCAKVQHILAIWASGQGVVSVHCFQNAIPVEAYTREACMVDAIGLRMLTNQKRGNYYGTVASWPLKRRRRLGVHLLHRAMQIFLAEGERQLRPADL